MTARGLILICFLAIGLAAQAFAAPARIIILRHGEKQNGYLLCSIGTQRSLALAANYLGSGAQNSLFPDGKGPDAFFVITLHTLELGLPAMATWKAPVLMYQVLPGVSDQESALNAQTQAAAKEVMSHKKWQGKTVVMIWEHKHISSAHNKHTLYGYLGLDKYTGTQPDPVAWPGVNYDFIWDIEFHPKTGAVKSFKQIPQSFPAPYQDIPSNAWNVALQPPLPSNCEQ
jgi:hypothetical protein